MMRQLSLVLIVCSILLAGCVEIAPGRQKPSCVEVLAFTAGWCSACRQDKPYVEQLQQAGIKIISVDADEHPELLDRFGVNLLPTYIVLENGIEVRRTNDIHTIGKHR